MGGGQGGGVRANPSGSPSEYQHLMYWPISLSLYLNATGNFHIHFVLGQIKKYLCLG